MKYTHVGCMQTRIFALESLFRIGHKTLQYIWTVWFDASGEESYHYCKADTDRRSIIQYPLRESLLRQNRVEIHTYFIPMFSIPLILLLKNIVLFFTLLYFFLNIWIVFLSKNVNDLGSTVSATQCNSFFPILWHFLKAEVLGRYIDLHAKSCSLFQNLNFACSVKRHA